jgi:hypothetical protein
MSDSSKCWLISSVLRRVSFEGECECERGGVVRREGGVESGARQAAANQAEGTRHRRIKTGASARAEASRQRGVPSQSAR